MMMDYMNLTMNLINGLYHKCERMEYHSPQSDGT